MGNTNKNKYIMSENHKIFDLMSNMQVKEKLFKNFFEKFEYKIYKKPIDDKKYELSWDEFSSEMLNNFADKDTNYKSYVLFETFKKLFEYHNNSLRIFKIYMLYFPLVLHITGTEGLNFIELVFEKVLYNLEIEMNQNNRSYLIQDVEISADETKSDRSQILSQSNIIDKTANKKFLDSNSYDEVKVVASSRLVNSVDHRLLTCFSRDFNEKNPKKKFIRTIPLNIFKEIMIVYFHTNITFILRAFKDAVKEFNPKRNEDKLVNTMASFRHNRINYTDLTQENVEKFIQMTINNLIKRRHQLKTIEYEKIYLTYDDIYVYYKFNSYFLNCYTTYQEFLNFIK